LHPKQRVLAVLGATVLAFVATSALRFFDRSPGKTVGPLLTGPEEAFYRAWMHRHDAFPYECWTEEGYFPERSSFPRDIQILAATDYGFSDIYNGGLHQFFYNGTGVCAPEMVEWLERSGESEIAEFVREAMQFFGDQYPRSRTERIEKLPSREGRRKDWDPFYEIDSTIFTTFSSKRQRTLANKWLRETCGIRTLEQSPFE